MKFQNILSLFAVTGITLVACQDSALTHIQRAIDHIKDSTIKYKLAVDRFDGSTTKLLEAQLDLNAAFRKNIEKIDRAQNMTFQDTLKIQSLVQNVQSTVDSLLPSLVSKKGAIFNVGQGPAVRFALSHWVDKTDALAFSTKSKAPAEIAEIVSGFFAGIHNAFQNSREAYATDDESWKSAAVHDQIQNAIRTVQSRAEDLDRVVYNSREKSRHLFDALNTLNGAFVIATQRISTVPSVHQSRTAEIMNEHTKLRYILGSLSKNLIAKKDFVVMSGHGGLVSFALQGYLYEVKTFTDIIVSKFPAENQKGGFVARDAYWEIEKSLRDGVVAFETETDTLRF